MDFFGINRASTNFINLAKGTLRIVESIENEDVPCVFISYQRADEKYAKEVADYLTEQQLDIYFDLKDNDLKFHNQNNNPKEVVNSICKGLNEANYMLVIVSPATVNSPWVPFEVGYAFEKMDNKMKTLRHKGISKHSLPPYLKVKEMLNGTQELDSFIKEIRKGNLILEKAEKVKYFSDYSTHPLNEYLDR